MNNPLHKHSGDEFPSQSLQQFFEDKEISNPATEIAAKSLSESKLPPPPANGSAAITDAPIVLASNINHLLMLYTKHATFNSSVLKKNTAQLARQTDKNISNLAAIEPHHTDLTLTLDDSAASLHLCTTAHSHLVSTRLLMQNTLAKAQASVEQEKQLTKLK